MINITTVSIRLDDDMKKDLDEMCDEMGINLTTFFMIYAKKSLRDRKIPFEISAPGEPFYSRRNMSHIDLAVEQVKSGRVVTKSLDELETMAGE